LKKTTDKKVYFSFATREREGDEKKDWNLYDTIVPDRDLKMDEYPTIE
jgi:hypothetical protein